MDRPFAGTRLNLESVSQISINQRRFPGILAGSTALFLVNGNHEEAAAIHLNGTPDNPPHTTVSPANAKVEYIRSFLPQDEKPDHKNGEIAFSYNVTGKKTSQ